MGQGAFRRVLDSRGRPPGALKADTKTRGTGKNPDPALEVAHYRALFDFAPDGYLATDGHGRILEANRAAGALLHVRPNSLPGRSLARFICAEDRAEFHSRLTALRRSGRSGSEELRIRLQPVAAEPLDAALTGAKVPVDHRVALAWSLRDIRKRTRIERRLKESEQRYLSLYRQMLASRDELRFLAGRALQVREEESRRIARELHDEAGQMTASIHLVLAEIDEVLPETAQKRIDSVRGLLDELEERLRRLSHELRPTILDDLGIGPALEFLAKGFAARSGISAAVEGTTKGRLEPVVETAVYRIVQEALTNIARHARATRASIRLSREAKALRCSIRDNGVGLRSDPFVAGRSGRRGLGLLGIRERLDALGGKMNVRSQPGIGTELRVQIPIRSHA
jgi:two-component system, NarL family, sensor histidine kinase UhpB